MKQSEENSNQKGMVSNKLSKKSIFRNSSRPPACNEDVPKKVLFGAYSNTVAQVKGQ
jgi:hypothetical protein